MYTTQNFCTGLIQSVINYMVENKVDVFPLDFLANRNDYSSCENARRFYAHGYRYFTVENGELILHGVWDYLGCTHKGDTFKWIITEKYYGYEPVTIHHSMMTEDLIALVQIAYDTIGSTHFKGRGVESWDSDEIDELEAEYEARRNEV